jgi:hypothetical protein
VPLLAGYPLGAAVYGAVQSADRTRPSIFKQEIVQAKIWLACSLPRERSFSNELSIKIENGFAAEGARQWHAPFTRFEVNHHPIASRDHRGAAFGMEFKLPVPFRIDCVLRAEFWLVSLGGKYFWHENSPVSQCVYMTPGFSRVITVFTLGEVFLFARCTQE